MKIQKAFRQIRSLRIHKVNLGYPFNSNLRHEYILNECFTKSIDFLSSPLTNGPSISYQTISPIYMVSKHQWIGHMIHDTKSRHQNMSPVFPDRRIGYRGSVTFKSIKLRNEHKTILYYLIEYYRNYLNYL